jgi:DNA polymerase-3 subunit gamma/tau
MFYNKYRPQKVEDIDREIIRESLGKSILSNKFASAYLLIGGKGVGKTSMARLIAKCLNCEKRKSGEEPCNRCNVCQTIANNSNLDVIEIDAASNTGVEDIRDLREKIKLAPSNSKFKIYIIDEVHMLSNSAFNALLKTLEEPPGHVVFVLATTDPQKLPDTVRSRCQIFDFGRGTISEITRAIERAVRGEGLAVSEEKILEIAKAADGSFRDAHKLLEQVAAGQDITMAKIKNLPEFIELLGFRDRKKIVEWLESAQLPVKEFIEQLVKILHEDLLIKLNIFDNKPRTNLSITELKNLLEKLDQAYKDLRGAVEQKIPLELAFIEWLDIKVEKVQEVKKVEDRVPATADFGGAKWKDLLEKTRPYNHSLSAVLRGAKPIGLSGKTLLIGVNYKFHLDKLSEQKNIETVEKILEEIMGDKLRVKYIKQ